MADKATKIPFGRAFRLNKDYFVTRYKVLGEEKFIEFVREEAKGWENEGEYDRNLLIAQNAYKSLTGKNLPAITDADVMAELKAENERLRLEKEQAKDSKKVDEEAPAEIGGHSIANLEPVRRRRSGS